MNKELIIMIVAIVFIVVTLILLYKYKREYLNVLAYYAVVQAEEMYKSGEGQKKLEYAVNYVKSRLPWWLGWLISINAIKKVIEYVLSTLQGIFKGSKLKQIALLDNINSYGASPEHLAKLQNDVNTKGYVESYLEARTNLKGNNEIVGGVRAGMKL